MRWKKLCWGLPLMLATAVGCKQTVYMTKDDRDHVANDLLPAGLDYNPASAQPIVDQHGPPPTPDSPDRPIRYLSLAETIAIALETGRVGNQQVNVVQISSPGGSASPTTYNDQLALLQRTTNFAIGSTDSIRALRLDPAIIGAGIESSLSKFDAVFQSTLQYQGTNRPVGTALDAFETGNSGVNTIIQQQATYTGTLVKPLSTGGVAEITFTNAYENTNLPARVNPSYTPGLVFGFEQPLLQGFGTEINEIRASHPGSILNPGIANTSPTAEGILVTRIRFDQQRAEFERNVNIMVANAEIQYWNLYYAYWNLYAQEQGLRQSYEAWRILKAKLAAGTAKIADLAQTRGQYENFRSQRLVALNDLHEQERNLRGMIGLPSEDGTRLVPCDQPTLAPYRPNWETSWQEAMALRPELYQARQEVKAAQLLLRAAKDTLLPDVRFAATYDINGLGDRMDGTAPDNALQNLASDHFNNYSAEIKGTFILGNRLAHANIRQAELQISRAYQTVIDNEQKIDLFLREQWERVLVTYELININRSARESFAQQLEARNQELLAGRITTDVLLEAQRFFAAALAQEYQSIRDYNNTLVLFEFAKGTVLQRNNVVISEGALPAFAQERAAEHEKERNKALTLRTHAPVDITTSGDASLAVPAQPNAASAGSIQDLWQKAPPLKDAPQLPSENELKLPAPTPAPTPTTTPPSSYGPGAADATPSATPNQQLPAASSPMTTSASSYAPPGATIPTTQVSQGPAVTPAAGVALPTIGNAAGSPMNADSGSQRGLVPNP